MLRMHNATRLTALASRRALSTAASSSAPAAAPAAAAAASPIVPTAAELELLMRSKPSAADLAAFAESRARAAASKREWDEWNKQQARMGPAISANEWIALKLAAAGTAVWVAVRLYMWTQIPASPSSSSSSASTDSSADPDAIPAYPAAAPSGPSPVPVRGFDIPALDYRVVALSDIFSSMLQPLVQFDAVTEDFLARQSAAEERAAQIAARRKLGAVSTREIEAAEVELRKVRSEERVVMQPRLAYLRELYMTRSLELMQRSQFNAERMVQAGSSNTNGVGAAASTSTSTTKAPAAPVAATNLDAVRREVDAEMAQFQKLSQDSQNLVAIVDKYKLQGAAPVKRIMNAK